MNINARDMLKSRCINPWFDPNKQAPMQPEQQTKGKASASILLASKAKRARRMLLAGREVKA